MKIAMDIDGVVARTAHEMKYVASEMGITLRFHEYAPEIVGHGKDEKIVSDIVHFIFAERMQNIHPYGDAVKWLPAIVNDIGPVTFVTARNKKYSKKTKAWLKSHFPGSWNVKHLSSAEKPEFVLKNGFDAFVEDRLRTANQAAELGILTYLMARQWNSGRVTHPAIKRQQSLQQVYIDLLQGKEKNE